MSEKSRMQTERRVGDYWRRRRWKGNTDLKESVRDVRKAKSRRQ